MHGMWRDRTVYADRQHADDMSDAAPTAKDARFWAQGMTLGWPFNPNWSATERLTEIRPADEDWRRPWTTGSAKSCLWPDRCWPHSRARDAAPPIRCRHVPRRIDDRQDGPNPPSMSAEVCKAHHDLQAGHGSTAWFSNGVPYRRTAQVRILWRTGDQDGREKNGPPDHDGKIKAAPPWSVCCGRSMGYGVPPEREGWRFSGKSNRINANCATHGVFGCRRPGQTNFLDRVASI